MSNQYYGCKKKLLRCVAQSDVSLVFRAQLYVHFFWISGYIDIVWGKLLRQNENKKNGKKNILHENITNVDQRFWCSHFFHLAVENVRYVVGNKENIDFCLIHWLCCTFIQKLYIKFMAFFLHNSTVDSMDSTPYCSLAQYKVQLVLTLHWCKRLLWLLT